MENVLFGIAIIMVGFIALRWSVVRGSNGCFMYSLVIIIGGVVTIGQAVWSAVHP
jgi:hypothetical protein